MAAFVSLFRAINVGGNRKVGMADLKAMLESLGLKGVLPYIQSGNVIFHSDDADVARLQRQIEDGFETRFGFHSDVIIRTSAELEAIIANNPFRDQPDKESKWVVVMFLAARPDDAAQDALFKSYAGPEEFFFVGKDMYIYYPDGIGRSKLTGALIERKLKTIGTARNWNTILQVQKLIQQ